MKPTRELTASRNQKRGYWILMHVYSNLWFISQLGVLSYGDVRVVGTISFGLTKAQSLILEVLHSSKDAGMPDYHPTTEWYAINVLLWLNPFILWVDFGQRVMNRNITRLYDPTEIVPCLKAISQALDHRFYLLFYHLTTAPVYNRPGKPISLSQK